MIVSALRKARYEVLSVLDCHRSLFRIQMALRRSRHLALAVDTELVLEGYPRSANTFAVAAFEHSQGRKLHWARHLHSPAQVIRAVERGLPTLVLLRRPPDPILSLVIRAPYLSVSQALRSYIRFYETLEPWRDGFLTVGFEEVLSDFAGVIEKTNRRFSTDFLPFHDTPEARAAIADRIEAMEREDSGGITVRERSVARPSAERDKLKTALLDTYNAPALAPLRARAEAVYTRFQPSQPS